MERRDETFDGEYERLELDDAGRPDDNVFDELDIEPSSFKPEDFFKTGRRREEEEPAAIDAVATPPNMFRVLLEVAKLFEKS